MTLGKSKKSSRPSQSAQAAPCADATGSAGSSSPAPRPNTFEDFHCVRCGVCCTGAGFVNIGPEECARIAGFLGLPLQEFLDKYTRHEPGYERWLIDGEGADEPCVFLVRDADGLAGCRIQGEAKPVQCSTFPMKWRIRGFQKWCGAFASNDNDQ